MKRFVSFAIIVFIGLSLFSLKQLVNATEKCATNPGTQCVNLDNPLANKSTSIPVIIGTIIKYALGVVGSITLLMFVWGGFQWLTSAGASDKIKKGSQTMVWAAIGVALVFSSYLIVTTYLDYLTGNK